MKYTRYLINKLKNKYFNSQQTEKKIKLNKKSADIELPSGTVSLISTFIVTIIMLWVGSILYGSIMSSINTNVMGPETQSMLGLMPIVMIGIAILSIISIVLRD